MRATASADQGWTRWSGAATFFNHGVNNGIFIGAAALTCLRAVRFEAERLAWSCIAVALTGVGPRSRAGRVEGHGSVPLRSRTEAVAGRPGRRPATHRIRRHGRMVR